MGQVVTAKEVRQEYVNSLGQDLGPVFYALRNEVLWLHLRWSEYKVLFGGSHQRLNLLNESAGPFFRLVQNEFVRATLLHLCRLTDPPGRGSKKRLTLRQLPGLITTLGVGQTTEELVDEAVAKAEFAREMRNRAIAHTDLPTALDDDGSLFPIHRNDVDDAIAAVCAVLDHVSQQLMNQQVIFEVIGSPGAEALLYVIRDGLKAEEERKARIKEGRLTDEDRSRRGFRAAGGPKGGGGQAPVGKGDADAGGSLGCPGSLGRPRGSSADRQAEITRESLRAFFVTEYARSHTPRGAFLVRPAQVVV